MAKKTTRLRFTEDDLADAKVRKAADRAEKAVDKAEKAVKKRPGRRKNFVPKKILPKPEALNSVLKRRSSGRNWKSPQKVST